MEWSNLYSLSHCPTLDQIMEYVNNELWQDLNFFLQSTYNIQPKLAYSQCSMQRGWNLKYIKSGKSLCCLYPMENYFIALIVIGNKEMYETELLMPLCSQYTQELYEKTASFNGSRWLMVNLIDQSILDDVINLIQIRARAQALKN